MKPNIPSTSLSSMAGPSNQSISRTSHLNHNAVSTPTRPSVQQNQASSMASIPAHIRSEVNAASMNSNKGKAPMYPPHGLNTPMTTPLHQQPQRSSIPQLQAGRSISNAESSGNKASNQSTAPAVKAERSEEDDSFGFGSEDDAFLATADLGPSIINAHEADIGRPIETETDMGRPIDHEEGLLASEEAEDNGGTFVRHLADTSSRRLTPSNSRNDPVAAKTRQEIMEAALRGDPVDNSASKSSTSAPRQMQPPSILKASTPISLSYSSSSAAMSHPSSIPQQTNQASRTTSLVQQQHQRYVLNRQNQNPDLNSIQQNQNQPATSLTASEGLRRAQTPSVGGFNFPPGMVRMLHLLASHSYFMLIFSATEFTKQGKR